MRIRLLSALCIILSFTACEDRLNVGVDNPKSFPIRVQIDDQTLDLPPFSRQSLVLAPGRHEVITRKGDQLLVRGDFIVEKNGLLNATRSWYIRLRDVYFRPDVMKTAPQGILDTVTIKIYQQPFTGDLKVFSDEELFIPQEWNQQPDESLPDPATVKIRRNPGYLLVSKLYRIEDFIKEYSEGYITIDTASYRQFLDSIHQARP
jgi:hypothetical protein